MKVFSQTAPMKPEMMKRDAGPHIAKKQRALGSFHGPKRVKQDKSAENIEESKGDKKSKPEKSPEEIREHVRVQLSGEGKKKTQAAVTTTQDQEGTKVEEKIGPEVLPAGGGPRFDEQQMKLKEAMTLNNGPFSTKERELLGKILPT
jgi:hypothetical protein